MLSVVFNQIRFLISYRFLHRLSRTGRHVVQRWLPDQSEQEGQESENRVGHGH